MNERPSSKSMAQSLLREHGLDENPIVLLAGWTNEVWLSPTHAVRISSGRFRDSFRHEADTAGLIERYVRIPRIVANGKFGSREWMISERVAGQSLLHAWPEMALDERQESVRQLAANLEALHSIKFPDDFSNPWITDSITDPLKVQDAYFIEPRHFSVITNDLRDKNLIDHGLLDKAERYLLDRLSLFTGDQHVLVHGDAHFNNMIWDGSRLTIVDFEVLAPASRERELQAIIDFTLRPEMVYGKTVKPEVHSPDVSDILYWLRDAYPSLFTVENISERLNVYTLTRNLLQIYHFQPGSEYDYRPRLKSFLEGDRKLPAIFSEYP